MLFRSGPLSRVRDGDVITLDADAGLLTVTADLAGRPAEGSAAAGEAWAGTGRELFAAFRATVGPADQGASIFPVPAAASPEVPLVRA